MPEFKTEYVQYDPDKIGVKETYLSPQEKLCLETCPALDIAKRKAMNDTWNWRRCQICFAVEVQYISHLKTIRILGKCPQV